MIRWVLASLAVLLAIVNSGCIGFVSGSNNSPVPVAPSITTQPASQTVTAGQAAIFSVAATGTAPLTYQWQKNNVAISGANSPTYTTPATISSDSGTRFNVTVSNSIGRVTSSAATLIVNSLVVAPSVTTQPASQTVTVGQTASFSIFATGTAPLTYQWQKNNVAIPGANSSGYTTPATTTADSGALFSVLVSNSAGSVTSAAATLTVNAVAVAPSISTQPASQTVTVGQAATFSVVATGTAPLSYQWLKSGTAISGETAASYTTQATTSADNGSQFMVVVSNSAGSVTSNVATLTVNPTSCNLFVSPTGSDSNSGTSSAPWQTVQHAFDLVQPGETICFRAGSYPMATGSGYSQTLTASGTPSQPITITNYPGEMVILHGSTRVSGSYATLLGTPKSGPGLVFEGPTGPGSNLDLIDIINTHDVTFDHVEIRNGDYHAGLYQFGGYNIRVIGAYIHDNGVVGSNLDHGIYWDESTGGGNLIANCVIDHNAAQGIALYSSSLATQPSQVVVEENTIVNNGHYGVDLWGAGNTVVNNVVANNGATYTSQQMGIENGTNHIVDSNFFWSPTVSLQSIYNATGQTVTHSIILDPLFADSANHNYHLLVASPGIGAGNPSYTAAVDKDGVPRKPIPSVGAYEYVP